MGYDTEKFLNINIGRKRYIHPQTRKVLNLNDEDTISKALSEGYVLKRDFDLAQKDREKSAQTVEKHTREDENYYEKITEKRKKSFIDHYGVDNNMKSEEGRETYSKAIMDKYGVDHMWKSPTVRDHMKQTNLKLYGTEYAMQSLEVKSKVETTCLGKYGSPSFFGSDYFKQQQKEKNLREYGVEYS